MSNQNADGIDSIHDLCAGANIAGEDGGYFSQESSDTPPSPIDETSPPFLDHSHYETSQFEPADEEYDDEFHYNDEFAIKDITKGIAFVLVHEKPAEKIKSSNIRSIVRAGKINIVLFMLQTLMILFSKRSDANDAQRYGQSF